MEDKIIKFLRDYISLSEEEANIIKENSLVKEYPKGTILLKEGELAKRCYFVLDGCLRTYYLVDGEEKNTAFYSEKNSITPVSYIKGTPSEYYISCLEDCILSVGTGEKTREILDKLPHLESVIGKISIDLLANNRITSDDFKKLSPEEHYLNLLKTKPDLCSRVPQYHLASYLGIKPESLSRIRKRIRDKEKLV